MGKPWKQWPTLFSWAPKSLQIVTAAMKLKDACSLEEMLWPTYHIKKQRHYFTRKDLSSQSYGFSSSHVWMWKLDYKTAEKVKVKLFSHVQLFGTPWTIAYQASLSIGFSRQEYWSGLPFPSPGDLPNPGIEPGSPALQADTLPSEPPWALIKKKLSAKELMLLNCGVREDSWGSLGLQGNQTSQS